MNKLFEKRKLWEVLSVVLATFLVILIGGNSIAMKFKDQINNALRIQTSGAALSDDEAYQYYKRTFTDDQTDEKNAYYMEVCEELEGEGLVLMKNENNALPLAANSKVSLFLDGSVRFNYGVSGSSSADTSSYKDLKTALTDQGLSVNGKLWDFYSAQGGRKKSGTGLYTMNEVAFDAIDAGAIADVNEYNVAILTFARNGGESYDLSADKSDGEDGSYLAITPEEESVLKGLTTLKGQGKVSKIIVLLNSASPMELDFLYREGIEVDACMWVGNVGITGITAVAKALVGKIVPSGKLSDTFARDNFSSPAMAQQALNTGRGAKNFNLSYGNGDDLADSQVYYGVYNEGIYVGYRYYETRYADYVLGSGNAGDFVYSDVIAYPFGYGTSYTTFEYSDYSVTPSADGKSFEVSVKVTNKGDYKGKESVQVYLQKPYTDYDKTNKIEKAAVELVGYAKTAELDKNASEIVKITVSKEQFRSYDANGAKTYIVDAGDYYLTVANGSHEAINNILAAQGKTPDNTGNKMDAVGNASMADKTTVAALDTTTYAVSTHTGNAVTNQFDFADANKNASINNANTVTYVSRSDWTATWPSAKIVIDANDALKAELAMNKAIPATEATMPTYGAAGDLTIAKLRGKDFNDEDWDKLLNQMTFAEQAEIVATGYFKTAAVVSVSKPATVESDGPTGITSMSVQRDFSPTLPSEGIWAATYNDELIKKAGDALAEDALSVGVTGVYAGGMNIHRTPFGGRAHEYFSEDPYLSGAAAIAETSGLQSKGVIAHVKHFAFNDQEAKREGISTWVNEQEAREIMLAPFEMVLSSDKEDKTEQAHAVMTGFNRIGAEWAGASKNLLINVLVEEWGFDGYNITDMAQNNVTSYMNYQDGLPAGTNLYLKGGSGSELDGFKDNATMANAIRESAKRVLFSVANYSVVMNGYASDTAVTLITPWWQTLLTVGIVIFAVLTCAAVALYAVSLVKGKKE